MDVDALEWCWWARDRHGRVALFDAGQGGVVPSALGYYVHRAREFDGAFMLRALLESGGALQPKLDLDGMFARAQAAARIHEPAELSGHEPGLLDCLIELSGGPSLHAQGWSARLAEEVEQARLRRMSWKPTRYWLRARPGWLAQRWSALGLTRALIPFTPQPADFGAFEYRYDSSLGCYALERGPRASVMRFEQFPTRMQSRVDSIDTVFGRSEIWEPEAADSHNYLSREAFVRRYPHIWR